MPYLLIPILFGSLLCYYFLRKKKETNKKPSTTTFKVFTFLWTNILCILLFFLVPELVNNSYAYLTYPKYDAEIVDIISKYEWLSRGGSKGRRVTMHTPIVRFKLEESLDYIEIPLNIRSEEKPELGDTIQVAYQHNSVYQISMKGYLFLAGTALLVLGLCYPLLCSFFYITGKDTTYLKNFGIRSGIYLAVLGLIIFAVVIFRAILN